MSPEQKGPDPKTPQTAMSGRESVFDRRLREYRNTGGFAKPQRKALQFIKNPSAEFETPSLDSRLHAKRSESEEYTEIERMAFVDESSGLLNSRTIMGKIATEMRRSARYKHSFSVLMIELDGLSHADSMTPLAVEMTFSNFCKIINKNIREVDIIGRFDQTSLLVICPETSLREAIIEAERLQNMVAHTHFKQNGNHSSMTASFGIASFPEHGNAAVDMLGAVMEATQQAVASGGNAICTAKVEPIKAAEKLTFASEEDFSPSTELNFAAEPSKPIEDMSPDTSKAIAFPTADVAPFVP